MLLIAKACKQLKHVFKYKAYKLQIFKTIYNCFSGNRKIAKKLGMKNNNHIFLSMFISTLNGPVIYTSQTRTVTF